MKKIFIYLTTALLYTSVSYGGSGEEYCSSSSTNKCVSAYGLELGRANDVVGYSNCRSECVMRSRINIIPGKDLKLSTDVPSGLSWQCVEYARRWWMLEYGVKFGSVETADQIFDLPEAIRLVDAKKFSLQSIKNEAAEPPRVGDLLIYKKDEATGFQFGHVAVIVNVNLTQGFVDIAEQNYENKKWQSPFHYARRIKVNLKDDLYTIYDVEFNKYSPTKKYEKETIRGWVRVKF